LFDNRITLTTAAYHVKRSNVFTLVGDTPVFNDQATNGVEADLNIQATTQWQIEANATAQHAALTDNPSNPAGTGKQPIGVPSHIVNLWTTYDFAIAGLEGFEVGGGVNYRDKIYGNLLNTNSVPSYVISNMKLSFKTVRWDMALGVKNIADKRYFTAADGAGGLVGDARTLYAQGDIHF
jgi:iron complex outermembrane recepter protein